MIISFIWKTSNRLDKKYHRDTTENKKREKIRDENIINSGYKVIHISEKEYNKNKELTTLKVTNYILKTKQLKNA